MNSYDQVFFRAIIAIDTMTSLFITNEIDDDRFNNRLGIFLAVKIAVIAE